MEKIKRIKLDSSSGESEMVSGSGSSSFSNAPTAEAPDRLVDDFVLKVVWRSIGVKWKQLGRELQIPDCQLDGFLQQYSTQGVEEVAYQMLRTWREATSTQATVAFLAEKLEEIERKDLADRILKMLQNQGNASGYANQQEAHLASQNEWLTWLQKKLRDKYLKLVLKGLPWMNHIIMTLSDFYVDLSVVTQGSNEEKKSKNISEALNPVFAAKDHPLRVLVEGAPGYGKTTLAAKLCFDHAKREKYIENFDLILLYPLRHFEGHVDDMIFEAALLSECCSKINLLAVVNSKSNRVLLVLDGFDETPKRHMKAILSLLQGELYPNLAIIVTSRPGQFTFERWETENGKYAEQFELTIDWNAIWQSRIKILGMTESMRDVFIKKHLAEFPENIRNETLVLLRQIEHNAIITSEFFECPLFLLMIILLLTDEENRDIKTLSTTTELYKRVFNFIVHRYCSKQKDTTIHMDLFAVSKAPKPIYVDLLCQFGEFAVWAITENKFSFSRDEILERDHVRDPRILEMGLLTQSVFHVGFVEKLVYEPVHKSLLEFAAAYALWVQFPDKYHDNWLKKALHLMRYERDDVGTLCLSMLIGLMQQRLEALLEALKPYAFYNVWDKWLRHSLCEMQLTEPVLLSVTSFLPVEWAYWKIEDARNSSALRKVLYHGVREGKVKCIKLWEHCSNPIPNDIVVDKAILYGFGDNVQKFKCNHLFFWNPRLSEDCEKIPHVFSAICFQTLSFVFSTLPSNLLRKFCIAVTSGILKNIKIRYIACKSWDILAKDLKLLTELVTNDRLTALRVKIYKYVWLIGSASLEETINNLLKAAASSSQLTSLILSNSSGQSITLDLDHIFSGGNKVWERLSLREFNIEFNKQTDRTFQTNYLNHAYDVVTEPLFRFVKLCQVTSLCFPISFLTNIGNLRLLHEHLTELNIVVNKLSMNTRVSLPTQLRNLSILILTMEKFEYQPLAFPVTEFLFGSNNCLRLKGIELWKASKNPTLSLEFMNCISENLEGHTLTPPTSEGRETLCSHPSYPSFPPKMLQLQYFLVRSYELGDVLDVLPQMKINLINKSLSRFDVVFNYGCYSDLLKMFSPAESFILQMDLWGSKSDSTIQSKMYYEFNIPLSSYRIISISHSLQC